MRRCELRRKDRLACRGTPRGISRWLRRDREPPVWRPRDARCAPRSGARARMVCRRGRAYARSAPSSGQGQAPGSGGQPRASQHRRTRMVDQGRRSGDRGPRDGGARRARRRQPTGCHRGGRPRFKRPWISRTSGRVALQVGTSAEVRGAMCGSRSNGRNTPASPTRAWRTTPRQLADMGYVAPIRVSRPPHSLCRSTNFWTLPVEVFGSGPNSIASGHL